MTTQKSPIEKLQKLGQSVWYDNVSRQLIESGGIQKLIDEGVTGLTSNPTIFQKAIAQGNAYDDTIIELAKAGKSTGEIFEAVSVQDIRAVADMLRPVYDKTRTLDGYACLEVNPHLAHDTDGTINEARRLYAALDRPNVMIKVPATPEGIPAIRTLIGEGMNINVTLTFSLDAYEQVRDAYIAGLEDLSKSGGDVRGPSSVASFFVSRVDSMVDKMLDEKIEGGAEKVKSLRGRAAIANAKLAYSGFKRDFGGSRFGKLRDHGAKPQRVLWASTSTKDPSYDDLMYVWNLVGPNTVNTMPQNTLDTLLSRQDIELHQTIDESLDIANQVFDTLRRVGVRMEEVTDRLLADGVMSFADSYDALMKDVERKRESLMAATR